MQTSILPLPNASCPRKKRQQKRQRELNQPQKNLYCRKDESSSYASVITRKKKAAKTTSC
jgi:hypothetical protein